MTEPKKKPGNRRGTGPANRFSQLLNAELRAIVAYRRMILRDLEEATGVSKARLSMVLNQDAAPLNTNEFELICRALEVDPADICARAGATRKKELSSENVSVSDKELAAQVLARAEAAIKSGYRLAAHPTDQVLTDDSNCGCMIGSVHSNESELFSEAINRTIRNWMDIRGENLLTLADKTGISKSKLSRTVYRSEGSLPIRDFKTICAALNVDMTVIISEADDIITEDPASA
jgi:hypothetical protein|nr:MAG TPA: Cro/C1-type HTH DNA-binding domain protein [Caudoviricetes sp.]DAY13994.1 MAG TPA: Cro/C1-type HTH DNA-binding domain protein [Caudoviricetes sp.]